MTATSAPSKPLTNRRSSTVLTVGAGVIVTIAAATIDAYSAIAAGADASFAPLTPAVYAPFAALGVIAAYIGWTIIRRRASRPARVLRVLVPVLGVLSFVPDVILAMTGFIPGASLTGVVALAIMHVIVIGVAVPVCLRLAPLK